MITKKLGKRYSEHNKVRGRLIVSVISLAITMMIVGLFLMISMLSDHYKYDDIYYGKFDIEFFNLDKSDSDIVKNSDLTKNYSEISVIGSFEKERVEAINSEYLDAFHRDMKIGSFPTENEIIVNNKFLEKYDYSLGDTIEIITETGIKQMEITGVITDSKFPEIERCNIYVNSEFYTSDRVNILIELTRSNEENMFAIAKLIDYDVYSLGTTSNLAVTGESLIGFLVVGVMVVILAVASITSIYSNSLYERIRTIGLLKSVGATKKQLKSIFYKEIGDFYLKGVGFGTVLSTLICALFILIQSKMKGNSFLAQLNIKIFLLDDVLKLALIGLLFSLLVVYASIRWSVVIAFRKSTKVALVESTNFAGSKKITKNKTRLFKNPIVNLSYLNLVNNKLRTILSIVLISISIALFIGFSSFFNSMSADVLSERLHVGDLLVTGSISEELLDDMKSNDFIEKIGILNRTKIKIPNEYIENNIKDKNVKDVITRDVDGNVVIDMFIIDDYFKTEAIERYDLDKNQIVIRDLVYLKDGVKKVFKQDKIPLIVDGTQMNVDNVFHSFNSMFNFYEHQEEQFVAITSTKTISQEGDIVAITVKTNGSIDKLAESLKSKYKDIDVSTVNETKVEVKKELYLIMFGFYAFITVISLLSLTVIINNLFTSIITRKKTIALYRCIGTTDKQLFKFIMYENIFYVLASTVIGVPLGYFVGKTVTLSLMKENTHFFWNFQELSILSVPLMLLLISVVTYKAYKSIANDSISDALKT
ncbi:ABC transporter permease [Mycoplasmatota bacterium]|nr:ABC transporter permease [Mycoplasmatota bacterium]